MLIIRPLRREIIPGKTSTGTEHAATEIDIQRSPPLVCIGFPEGTNRTGNGCVVDQYCDGTERTLDLLKRSANGRCICYVGSKGPRAPAGLLDRAGCFRDFRSRTRKNRRCHPGLGECDRDSAADSPPSAGDDGNLS